MARRGRGSPGPAPERHRGGHSSPRRRQLSWMGGDRSCNHTGHQVHGGAPFPRFPSHTAPYSPAPPTDMDYDQEKVDEAVLALLWLTTFRDGAVWRAWKLLLSAYGCCRLSRGSERCRGYTALARVSTEYLHPPPPPCALHSTPCSATASLASPALVTAAPNGWRRRARESTHKRR
jgi:hypothetical protein